MKDKINNSFIVAAVLVLLVWFIFAVCHSCMTTPVESNGVVWHGDQTIRTFTDVDYIQVKGFHDMYFKADEVTQNVNFYNPSTNSCIMDMKIYVDDKMIWQEDNIAPGYGLYKIELNTPVPEGIYLNCRYVVKCHSLDGADLNGFDIGFILHSEKE